ncbi:hypothetical protein E5676_scaffold106G00530 [Cucumis melo var. makuwa]|uniref:Reverse transcriptase n=1 Tax=Cucumis melo var. makuwa TaxID=1194695 RepID=A0A5D3CP88_CUCMM|nr:hypothetical protein E6C27_scaffold76G001110 [Cucumis melo var. makuwa]TYK12119.1 hypothetical protein E5676_scaffold106G00530 [Cucumis melo var. makuwa]
MSGLKINRNKWKILGINNNLVKLRNCAEVFSCEVGLLPSYYMGLPLGKNPRATIFWNPVCEKVWRRLAGWKKGFFSKAGRLTLIHP